MSHTDYQQHQQPPLSGYPVPPQKTANGMGVTALILGIIAILVAFIPFVGILSFILGIGAVILGIFGMRKKDRPRGTAIAGLVLGGLSLIIAAIVTTFTATVVGAVDEALQSSAPSASIEAPATTPAPSTDASEETVAIETEAAQAADTESTDGEVPREYESALAQAQRYSDTMSMSEAGLWGQLTSEYGGQFSAEAADYAVENVDADWNQNALDKAHDYQDTMNMSPAAIYDQLVSEYGEQFTADEAQYAVDNL